MGVTVDVVVVGGGDVVVVVSGGVGAVVVVVLVLPPLEPPPLAPPLVITVVPTEPVDPIDDVDVGIVVGDIEVMVDQRLTRPENSVLLDSEASVLTTLERTELESLPPYADAEASMFTRATRTVEVSANVNILGMR